MIELRAGLFDTELTLTKCEHCEELIAPGESKILIGTGNALLIVYHDYCWRQLFNEYEPGTIRSAKLG